MKATSTLVALALAFSTGLSYPLQGEAAVRPHPPSPNHGRPPVFTNKPTTAMGRPTVTAQSFKPATNSKPLKVTIVKPTATQGTKFVDFVADALQAMSLSTAKPKPPPKELVSSAKPTSPADWIMPRDAPPKKLTQASAEQLNTLGSVNNVLTGLLRVLRTHDIIPKFKRYWWQPVFAKMEDLIDLVAHTADEMA